MSETLDLFKTALGLGEPWRVTRSDFDVAQGRLDLYLDFPRGARFGCSVAGCDQGSCPVHDTEDKTWRHLDFFQYKAFLHARVPRARCPEHGVHLVEVVWARPESGFTLLFEALLIEFATAMPVARVAAMTREHDTRIWRVLEHHVAVQREKLSFADVRRVGMDETSARKGQDYVTTFMDLDARRVLFATEGKDASTVERFAQDLENHDGDPTKITDASIDMSPAFIMGVGESLPNAAITFDKFHAVKIINDAVDKVRRAEQEEQSLLRGTRYLWLRNPQTLSARQRKTLGGLPTRHLKTARAYQIRLAFQDLYQEPSAQAGASYLKKWYFWATHSRIEPVIAAARTVKRHWDGILQWFDSKIANGLIEGLNSLVQAAKAKARGYRTTRNLKAIIYLLAGKLDMQLPAL